MCKRGDLDRSGAHVITQFVGRIISSSASYKGLRYGSIFLSGRRQKAKAFTCFYGRAGEDDLFTSLFSTHVPPVQRPYRFFRYRLGHGEYDVIFIAGIHQHFLVGRACPYCFTIRAKYNTSLGLRSMNCQLLSRHLHQGSGRSNSPCVRSVPGIVSAGLFFLFGFNLFRGSAQFYLVPRLKIFKRGNFFQNVELTVVDAKEFNWVYGFEVNDRVCQSFSF